VRGQACLKQPRTKTRREPVPQACLQQPRTKTRREPVPQACLQQPRTKTPTRIKTRREPGPQTPPRAAMYQNPTRIRATNPTRTSRKPTTTVLPQHSDHPNAATIAHDAARLGSSGYILDQRTSGRSVPGHTRRKRQETLPGARH
jgi:hypothetical protein